MTRLRIHLRRVQRLLVRFRRPLAAVCTAISVLVVVHLVAPEPPPTMQVLVAARDLSGGSTMGRGDVRLVTIARSGVPPSALTTDDDVIGRTVVGPVAEGEMVTSTRLVGAGLVSRLGPDQVAAPVRVADADAVSLLRTGDRIDVFAATGAGDTATGVVRDALVLVVPRPDEQMTHTSGAVILLAVDAYEAARLAQQAARAPLSIAIRG
jgi:pilus assembly protein CpaB